MRNRNDYLKVATMSALLIASNTNEFDDSGIVNSRFASFGGYGTIVKRNVKYKQKQKSAKLARKRNR